MGAAIEVSLLGATEVRRDGVVVELGSRQQRRLIARLALDAGVVVPKTALIDALWPSGAPPSVDTTFASYLSNLRKTLEPDRTPGDDATVLVTRPPGYLLAVDAEMVDLRRAERRLADAMASADPSGLDAALGGVAGDPLAEFADEEFARPTVVGFTEMVIAARERRFELALERGEHRERLPELGAFVDEFPLRERARELLMLARYRSGQQADALRTYDEGRRLLVDELGVEPGDALRDLHGRILRQDPSLGGPADPSSVGEQSADTVIGRSADRLLGRDAAAAHLTERIDALADGRGGIVLVTGEAGIGKTELTTAATDAADRGGVTTAHATAIHDAAAPPLWLWTEVIRAIDRRDDGEAVNELPEWLRDDLGGLAPGAADRFALRLDVGDDQSNAAFTTVDRLISALVALAEGRRVLVTLDDLHWADGWSLRALDHMSNRVVDAPILIVAAHRHAESDIVRRLVRRRGATHVALDPLSADQTADLVRRAGGRVDDGERLFDRTGGNPLFVSELARRAIDRDEPADAVEAPPSLIAAIAERFAEFDDADIAVMVAAALTSDPTDRRLIGVASELDGATVDRALARASTAGLVTDDPVDGVRFVHDLMREALVDHVPRSVLAGQHGRLANALAASAIGETDADRAVDVARHVAAGAVDPPFAVHWIGRAARVLNERYEPSRAAELTTVGRRSIRNATIAGDDRVELLVQAAEANRALGRNDAARDDFLDAFELAAAGSSPTLLGRVALAASEGLGTARARTAWNPGPLGLDLVQQALDAAPDRDDPTTAWLLATLGADGSRVLADDRVEQLTADGVAMAGRLDDRSLEARLTCVRLVARWCQRPLDELRADAAGGVSLAVDAGDVAIELLLRAFEAALIFEAGDIDAATAALDEAQRRARRHRYPPFGNPSGAIRSALLAGSGHAADAQGLLLGGLDKIRSGGVLVTEVAVLGIGVAGWHCGDVAPWADELLARSRRSGRPWAARLVSYAAAERGDRDAAAAILREHEPEQRHPSSNLVGGADEAFDLGIEALAGIDRDSAAAYERLAPLRGRIILPGQGALFVGPADWFLALGARTLGDDAAMRHHLEACRDWARRVGSTVYLTRLDRLGRGESPMP